MREVKFALAAALILTPMTALAQQAKPDETVQTLPPVTVVTKAKPKTTNAKVAKKPAVKPMPQSSTAENANAPLNGGDNALPQSVTSQVVGGVIVTDPDLGRVSSVTHEGLTLLGGGAQTSFYQAANILPSVNVESPDPYGLSATRNINIAGKSDFHLSRNINGLPVAGIVGGADLYDLENIYRLDVYRGPIPADKSLGMSNASGVIDQIILGPQDKPSNFIEQSFGSWDFSKTFARFDSGLLSTGTKFFVSGSTTDADKWTGVGDNSRDNAALGWSQTFGDALKVDVNAVYNKFDGNPYRALRYDQILNLKANYKFDYNSTLTGNSATDVNYYKFNRSSSETYALQANIDYEFAEGQHVVFKPYYWNNDGVQYSAAGSNVQIWRQENDNVGGVLEYNGHFGTGTDLAVGYWWQSMAPPPPPTDQRRFKVTPSGELAFDRWSTIARIDDFVVNSPYAQLTQAFGSITVTGGLRYMSLGAPDMQYYNGAGVPDGTLDDALATNPALLPGASVAAHDYNEFLPNIAITKDFGAGWSANIAYGRNFGRPDWGPQASNYISNRVAFQAKGISLQDLVDKVKPEIADQFAAQVSFQGYGLTIIPSVFYAEHTNKQVKVIDPGIGPNIAYYEGTGSSTEYGAELQVAYQFGSELFIFGSGTLASETFDADTPTLGGGALLETKGKQIPNTPQTMLKGGLTYSWNGLSFTPVVRYIGERYGDAANIQKVSAHTVADFTVAYDATHLFGLEEVTMKLGVVNVFDSKYISQIAPNDFDLSSNAQYYVGAPRTFVGTVAVKF
ncbi:TonB-dependent receptor [Hyphomicrobium sp.]|uniref:TonB-dependent receptor n=1 Tax=Hyphomicrobium sp. TaxID=82 RepID=UPI002E30DD79|nr:TonB-dependent receptor [Hyphomicrobium sp.]HEX2841352.1 TonB-dependent receptor [Hyphomicrobium sp.]